MTDELRKHEDTLQGDIDRRILREHDLSQQLDDTTRKVDEVETQFRLLVESITDHALFMLDTRGNVVTWNAGAQRFMGYTTAEIVGRHCSVFFSPADVAAGKCELALEAAVQLGRHEEQAWRTRKDGTRLWANVVTTPMRDGGGQLVGFAKVTRDLTERKAAEDQRRTDEQRFRLLIESVQDYAIFLLDPNGIVTTWNTGAERFKGYKAHEIIGQHFSRFYPEADIRAGKCELELETAARVGRFEDEGWRIHKDGSRIWVNVIITALRDESGTLLGFGKVTRDLTERKRAEEERHTADARFRLLVDSVQDYAIFILDPDGNIATWNAGAERIKGYSADEIIGTHFSRFYPPEDVKAGKCELELAGASELGRYEDEGWRVRKDGSTFWANVVISAIRNDLGTLIGFSKVTRDLTDRRRNEQDRAARIAAEQANKTKDEFLAMLGHELRNPLAPIVSALQLLKLRGDPKSLREHQIIDRQVRQMIRLVDDLLDVSRISRGKVELQRKAIDVRDALAQAVEIAIPLFEKKGQIFGIDVPNAPILVFGDEARLIQVFANLLNNASKFTREAGHIRLAVGTDGPQIVIEVRDDGIGIDPALLPHVFELFVQGQQNPQRPAGGLGIGLTLVRSLVELHDGRVEVRSAGSNRGTTFVVRLPLAQEPTVSAPPPEPTTGSSHVSNTPATFRILIVDDNEDARTLLADILETLGHDVKTAGDGPDALALLGQFSPEFAILDIGLPGMDGYELGRKIRQLPGGDKVRLVALTGYGQAGDEARSDEAGFRAHLVKPIAVRRILDVLATLR